jgi:Ti-type conjugative transfer relaxase TraA
MLPAITAGGQSFKGAALYYLHDKRQQDEAERLTSGRVAWIETINLPAPDPERAWRMMAHTALAQPALKAAAGTKATGRKLTRPVHAYSLAWHPSERPTKAEQIEAARDSLAAQGLDEYQAMIVCHDDEPQPHVHVIVNRVHPVTGKAATLSKSKLKLSQWAEAYERKRGMIFCAQRAENNARRRAGEFVRQARTPRPVFEFNRAAGNDDLGAAFAASQQKQQDAHLYEIDRAITRSHAGQWRDQDRLYRNAIQALHATGSQAQAGKVRAAFLKQCDLLRDTQARQRDEQGEAWRKRNAERRDARASFDRESTRQAGRAYTRSRAGAAADPAAIIKALTEQNSTFTRGDLVRHLWKHYATETMRPALAAVMASPDLVHLGPDRSGRERFTARDLHAIERRMIADAETLHGLRQHPVSAQRQAAALRNSDLTLSDEQTAAFRHVTGSDGLAAVVGFAGAGKSTMLGAARTAYEAEGYRVRGAALSGTAADSLSQGAGIGSQTIHSLLYALDKGRDSLTARDVLVVDEAGMIGSRLMARLLTYVRAAGAKIVLVGDPEQLQAIEAGAAFRAIIERCGAARMTEVRRQREAWQQAATAELATERTADALDRYEAAGMVHRHDTHDAAMAALVEHWDRARRAAPAQSQIILAYTRADVRELNKKARAVRRAAGELGAGQIMQTAQGEREFAAGDRVYFLKNDRDLNVRNGTLGTVVRLAGDYLTVRLDDGRAAAIDIKLYPHLDHGYAATVHKSQGVTVDRAHLLASRYMDRHAAYVGMTRHRDRLDVHWAADGIPDRAALSRIFGRDRAKDTSLDHGPRRPEPG